MDKHTAERLERLEQIESAAQFLNDRAIVNTGRFHANPIDVLLQMATEAGWRSAVKARELEGDLMICKVALKSIADGPPVLAQEIAINTLRIIGVKL